MTRTTTTGLSWLETVDRHLTEVAGAAPDAGRSLESLTAAVASAHAALGEAAARVRDPFGWASVAALDCAQAQDCLEAAGGWPLSLRPAPAACDLTAPSTDELLAGSRELLTAAHAATLVLVDTADTATGMLLLTDAAAELVRPLLVPPA